MLQRKHFLLLAACMAFLIDQSTGNTCRTTFVNSATTGGSLINVFTFTCPPGNPTNPVIPASQSATAQMLVLSPNLYTVVPYAQLCSFTYVFTLVMSYNQITSLSGAFKSSTQGCLTALNSIDFSNNLINTPLTQADFDDQTASQIVSLNLTNNLIKEIRTSMFFKADGVTTRFPNLKYLGLAFNGIRQLDLLWPLSLPQSSLFIDMRVNPLTFLVNELNLSYIDNRFRYPMIGNRSINIQNNELQYIDDTNLIQYGLQSASDFAALINKILNYDFSQTDSTKVFFCVCSYSTTVNTWYQLSFSQMISGNYPIYRLYCNSYTTNVYIFNFGPQCNISVS
jgi:hypothetical protein